MHGVRGDDRGETLIELIVAIAILGIAAVAIMAGFQLSIQASTIGRNQATSDAVVRTAAEAIQNSVAKNGISTCASAVSAYKAVGQAAINSSAYDNTGTLMAAGTYSLALTGLQSWAGTTWGSCSDTNGSQMMTLAVTSPGDATHNAVEKLVLILRKPCSGSVPTVASQTATPC